MEFSLKKPLFRDHGANAARIQHVDEKSFDDVVLVVTQREFVAPKIPGYLEQSFPTEPGAEKARVVPVLFTVSQGAMIRHFDNQVKSQQVVTGLFELFGETVVETRINVYGVELIINGEALASFVQDVEKGHAVFTSGKANNDPVPVLDHVIRVIGLSGKPVDQGICFAVPWQKINRFPEF